ncbi:MAG: lipocalin-like domain-containing protein [Beijerinckiaceae bacterium]
MTDFGASMRTLGTDARKFIGTWRLIAITSDGKINPQRGASPTGLITYHESGWMAAQIQPDRAPVAMAGAAPTPGEALAALHGYTAYFGTWSIDEAAKIVTHHRTGSVTPGWEARPDFRRAYVFEGDDRVLLHPIGNRNELVWERLGQREIVTAER